MKDNRSLTLNVTDLLSMNTYLSVTGGEGRQTMVWLLENLVSCPKDHQIACHLLCRLSLLAYLSAGADQPKRHALVVLQTFIFCS